ncbi:hypothetical protein BDZ90DRAFT_218270 [Jaminaea rosea]|uniref:Protein YTP1-like C-terminal domain-containing protein n=1 Tax=Jaminaea rosea TaxID=1569628 RepID=A0A316UUD4_9BASI|nr:hypothetical protein BDZ90DRAFT_218270 [Jaminaea rosea]PWN28917.1 hypothetical protein BDZ90DRAFT_218270 [Jaminaea rosea]
MRARRSLVPLAAVVVLATRPQLSLAHEHHHDGPADPSIPIDSILKLHILFQAVVWTILFPTTMVLGLIRHRLHVPLATVSLALTTAGYFFGHGHGGRSFPHTAHGTVASLLVFYLFAQMALGMYLKLHLSWKAEGRIRPVVLGLHGLLGKTFPILGWVQMVLGIATLQSWCFGGHLGQCLAHYIMGSSFVAYSVILLIMLKAGAGWLARRGRSQEWFDSWVICLWGLVNSFTEHHGGPWTHKDLQHTLLGVVWFFGGAAGIWTSRGGKRSIFPGIIIGITGWAMSGHAQALMLSTMVHGLFGYALMAAGVARVIEVCFVLNDRPTGESDTSPDPTSSDELTGRSDWSPVRAFQLLPPWLLTAAGILFMSATDEELRWADGNGIDHITWGLIDFSIAFFLFVWFNILLDLYTTSGGRYGARVSARSTTESGPWYSRLGQEGGGGIRNGGANGPRADKGGYGDHGSEEESSIEAESHVLFDEGDLDAEEIDPFDDERLQSRQAKVRGS